jgi:hypothetical protein
MVTAAIGCESVEDAPDKIRPGIEPLVTPAELAAILQVAPNTARRIMREEGGTIFVGKRLGHEVAELTLSRNDTRELRVVNRPLAANQ